MKKIINKKTRARKLEKKSYSVRFPVKWMPIVGNKSWFAAESISAYLKLSNELYIPPLIGETKPVQLSIPAGLLKRLKKRAVNTNNTLARLVLRSIELQLKED